MSKVKLEASNLGGKLSFCSLYWVPVLFQAIVGEKTDLDQCLIVCKWTKHSLSQACPQLGQTQMGPKFQDHHHHQEVRSIALKSANGPKILHHKMGQFPLSLIFNLGQLELIPGTEVYGSS